MKNANVNLTMLLAGAAPAQRHGGATQRHPAAHLIAAAQRVHRAPHVARALSCQARHGVVFEQIRQLQALPNFLAELHAPRPW